MSGSDSIVAIEQRNLSGATVLNEDAVAVVPDHSPGEYIATDGNDHYPWCYCTEFKLSETDV